MHQCTREFVGCILHSEEWRKDCWLWRFAPPETKIPDRITNLPHSWSRSGTTVYQICTHVLLRSAGEDAPLPRVSLVNSLEDLIRSSMRARSESERKTRHMMYSHLATHKWYDSNASEVPSQQILREKTCQHPRVLLLFVPLVSYSQLLAC